MSSRNLSVLFISQSKEWTKRSISGKGVTGKYHLKLGKCNFHSRPHVQHEAQRRVKRQLRADSLFIDIWPTMHVSRRIDKTDMVGRVRWFYLSEFYQLVMLWQFGFPIFLSLPNLSQCHHIHVLQVYSAGFRPSRQYT